jgi:hypothetical protein
MQYEDRSTSGYTRRKAQKAIAAHYKIISPVSLDSSTLTTLRQGQQTIQRTPITPVCGSEPVSRDDPGCCCPPPTVEITPGGSPPCPPPYNSGYSVSYNISWEPTGQYTPIISGEGILSYIFLPDGPNSGTFCVKYQYPGPEPDKYTISLLSPSTGCAVGRLFVAPCFLAGSLIALADSTTKPIEDIRVGDIVVGAFGEHNEVLALHRPLLGKASMSRINDEHSTTSHHPHVSVDRKFYCADPATVETSTYGHEHNVIDATGAIVKRMLHGLRKGRVQQLTHGITLKTIEGSRPVVSMELYDMPPETQLYNLVVGGSHTYHVDGYAVTGWPREDDFDYDAWVPL